MNEAESYSWNEFARELRRRSRWDLDKIEHSLAGALEALPSLERKEREELLKVGWVVAERSSKLAVSFLRIGPTILSSLSTAIRSVLIRWAMILADHSVRRSSIFWRGAGRSWRSSRRKKVPFFSLKVWKLAHRDPSISFKFFINLPPDQQRISRDRFSSWFEEGLTLIPQSIPAAMAYFALESRRSQERPRRTILRVPGRSLRPMKLFAQALTGRSLGLRLCRS